MKYKNTITPSGDIFVTLRFKAADLERVDRRAKKENLKRAIWMRKRILDRLDRGEK
jgi:hypothetical protein